MEKFFSFSKDSKESSNIFFHILTNCNLKCYYCYVNPEQHGYRSLDFTTITSWLRLFSNREAVKPNLILLGGEPTLHPKLSSVIKVARKLEYNSIIIDTNGYRVLELLEEVEPGEIDFFNFSLDGPTAQSNDKLRGKGSFECCLKSIYETKKRGFKIGLIFTVSTANFKYLNLMPEFLSSLGVDHFFIQVLGIRGKWIEDKKCHNFVKRIDKVSWLETVPNLARKIVKKGIAVTYPKVYLEPDDEFKCAGLLSKNLFVFPNGRVYRCPICEDYSLHSKEIKNNILYDRKGIREVDLFNLNISEGCVMNKIVQPDNISYHGDGSVKHKIACCMLKEELIP